MGNIRSIQNNKEIVPYNESKEAKKTKKTSKKKIPQSPEPVGVQSSREFQLDVHPTEVFIYSKQQEKTIEIYRGDQFDNKEALKVLNHYIQYKTAGIWLYKSNANDHWWICPEYINQLIESDFIAGHNTCSIPTIIGTIDIDFVDKVQRLRTIGNTNTVPRQIIRIRNDDPNLFMVPVDNYEWVYATKKGDKAFDKKSQQTLTNAYLKDKYSSVMLSFSGFNQTYNIDFQNMTQANTFSRKIHLIRFKVRSRHAISGVPYALEAGTIDYIMKQ